MVRRRSSRSAAGCFFVIFLFEAGTSAVVKRVNQTYYMEGASCGSEVAVGGASVFSHLQWSAHHPAVVAYGHNTDCTIVFRARRDGWRLLLRFDYIDIPDRVMNQQLCRDAVYVYDSNAVGSRAVKAAGGNAGLCGDIVPPAITSTGRYMTVYFRSDGGGRQGRGFKFTLTAFNEDDSCGDLSFKCRDDKCIEEELACDGVQHCADGSDEGDAFASGRCLKIQPTVPSEMKMSDEQARTVWDDFLELGIAACVGIVGGTLVVIILLVICIACTCKKCLNKDTDVQPRQTTANSSHVGLLPPLSTQAILSATPSYKPAPWAGLGQAPPSHNQYGVQGYFPLTPHNGTFLPPPAQPPLPEAVFSPHVHRESYSMPSGSYGTPKSAGGSSGAFAQPMHTRPTGPTPRSYTPTTTLSSRSGGSSTVTYPRAGTGILSQL